MRSSAVMRSFCVKYLNSLLSAVPLYPFQPRVVNRSMSLRTTAVVSQLPICVDRAGGKSLPWSTTHPMREERGGGEKRRAPKAAKEPAPPSIFLTGGRGCLNSISSSQTQTYLIVSGAR